MVMSRHEWAEDQRRFYDVLPTWWWHPDEQDKHYKAYKKATDLLCLEKVCKEERKPQWGDPTVDME